MGLASWEGLRFWLPHDLKKEVWFRHASRL